MQQILVTFVLLLTLTGCAQPTVEQPRVNGSYLVIEDDQAWAVLVSDGERIEEPGVVVDTIRLAGSDAPVAGSYLIETPNCGKVQWLVERQDAADGLTTRMTLHDNQQLSATGCHIGAGLSRVWTVLDYSSRKAT